MEVGAYLDVWGRWGSWSWGGQSEAGWDGPPGASILAGLSAKPHSSHRDAPSGKHRVTPSAPAGRGGGTLFCIPAAGWLAHLITVTDSVDLPLFPTALHLPAGRHQLQFTAVHLVPRRYTIHMERRKGK